MPKTIQCACCEQRAGRIRDFLDDDAPLCDVCLMDELSGPPGVPDPRFPSES